MQKKFWVAVTIIATVIVVWLLVATLDLPLTDWFEALRDERLLGLSFLTALIAVAIIFPPLAVLPAVPLAANLWGWEFTLLSAVVGWQIGSVVGFWVSRRFGRRIVARFVDLKKADKLIASLPKSDHFVIILLLRMILPVDLLAYALGLTRVKFSIYFWATLLGVLPFGFLFTYGGEVAFSWQIVPVIAAGLLFFFAAYRLLYRRIGH